MDRGAAPSRLVRPLLIAASCIASAMVVALVVRCDSIRWAYEREASTPLAVIECDLSEPGEIRFPLSVRYEAGHGLKVLVDGPPFERDGHEPAPWLDGLDGIAAYEQAPFAPPEAVRLMEWLSFASGPDARAIVRMPGSPPGEYQILLVVTSGASGLADRPHRVVVMNDVCGCETLACVIYWPAAGVLAAFALVFLTFARRVAGPHRSASAAAFVVT